MKKIEDLTTLEDRMRVLAGFILDQKAIPAEVLDTLDGINMSFPWLRVMEEKAEKFDAERRGTCPESEAALRDSVRYLKARATYYKGHVDAIRGQFPLSASALDAMARAADRQANHLQRALDRYYPKVSG